MYDFLNMCAAKERNHIWLALFIQQTSVLVSGAPITGPKFRGHLISSVRAVELVLRVVILLLMLL